MENQEIKSSLEPDENLISPETEDIYYDPDEKKRKKSNVTIVVIVLSIMIAITGVITFVDIPVLRPVKNAIGNVLEDITYKITGETGANNRVKNILSAKGLEQETNTVPFDNAAVSEIAYSDKGIVISRANYIARYTKKGELEWSTATSISEPILDISGDYIVLADNGGSGICLYYNEKLVFSVKSENPIVTVDVSTKGDVVITTDKEYSKGAVEVFNKEGRRVFSWTSGSECVLNAAISDSKRRIAVTTLNTDEKVKSFVHFFDINETQAYHKALLNNGVVVSTEFSGSVLDVTADNCLAGFKISGENKWSNEFGEGELEKYEIDGRGNKIVSLEKDAVPYVHVYAEDGELLSRTELGLTPDYIDIYGRTVLYNQGRAVYFGTPGKEGKFTASMDVKNLKIIDSSSFVVVYNNSIEFVNA